MAAWRRRVFEMRHLQNLSIPEIAKRTQRSNDAVRSSLYRVKRMMLAAAEPVVLQRRARSGRAWAQRR